ncbi:hypothetical protein [Chroococcidiopsis sp.]|uniref:hypothetical protein n=1 Tax=Chroococcidiopsis sp. TaxID=3088168 RepID=UPI003F386109
MMISTIRPETTSSESIAYITEETPIDLMQIDCYPYATRGVLYGLLFAIIFWGSIIGMLMLAF